MVPGGWWFLNIGAANAVDKPLISVSIVTDSLFLVAGNNYALKKLKRFAYGQHGSGLFFYQMNGSDVGTLFVTKHDEVQRILSGRFSFTATNSNNEKVNITEGRFDVRY